MLLIAGERSGLAAIAGELAVRERLFVGAAGEAVARAYRLAEHVRARLRLLGVTTADGRDTGRDIAGAPAEATARPRTAADAGAACWARARRGRLCYRHGLLNARLRTDAGGLLIRVVTRVGRRRARPPDGQHVGVV